jgi:hypothetical protein
MQEWCMEHPLLTVFLICMALYTLREIVRAIAKQPSGD